MASQNELSLSSRLRNAWNAFTNNNPSTYFSTQIGAGYASRPDRVRMTRGNERSIITAIYNRIALDVSAVTIEHVKLDDNGRFNSVIDSGLNKCLTVEANIDQTARAFILDAVLSMFDEGCVALVPVDTSINPKLSSGYDILSMRTGKIVQWYPRHVRVQV